MFGLFLLSMCVVSAAADKTYWKGEEILWEDTELSSLLWDVIKRHDSETLKQILSYQSIVPPPAMIRSGDGRGPLFWAYEFGFQEGISILETIGVSRYTRDGNGETALQAAYSSNQAKVHTTDHFVDDEDADEQYEDDEYRDIEF